MADKTFKDNDHGPACPHLGYLKALIGRLKLDICANTVISRKAQERRAQGLGALHFRRRYRSRPDFLSGCFLTGLTGLRRIAVVCDDARYYSGSGGKRSSRTCRDRHQSCKIL
jgi:hypothetical protein